jgi:hypothetical protein
MVPCQRSLLLSFSCLALFAQQLIAQSGGPVYEIRTYTVHDGRHADMLETFRNYWTKTIFPKHDLEGVIFLTPTDTPFSSRNFVYILRHSSRAAADSNWTAFIADPEVRAISARRNANGRIVAKVDRMFATEADFSPVNRSSKNDLVTMSCDSARGEVADVCKVNALWDEANLKMDASIVEPTLDKDFFWVAGERLRPKADVIQILQTTNVRFEVYESTGVIVYHSGNMAHAVGISRRKVRIGNPEHTGDWRFTRTFVKRDGRWRILSHHYTKLGGG